MRLIQRVYAMIHVGAGLIGGPAAATAQGQLVGAVAPERAHDSMMLRLAGQSKGDAVPTTAEGVAAALAKAQQKRADGGREGGECVLDADSFVAVTVTGVGGGVGQMARVRR